MFSSLGDFVVVSDLARKVRSLGADTAVIHANNPLVTLLPEDERRMYFNVRSFGELARGIGQGQRWRSVGKTIFGIQQAPGSLRGFFFLRTMKKLGGLTYVVDPNLYDADIIMPWHGKYILEMHLNQVAGILGKSLPAGFGSLSLPATLGQHLPAEEPALVGIHPWSRRDAPAFTWPPGKWILLLNEAGARYPGARFLVFGRDRNFETFTRQLLQGLSQGLAERVELAPVKDIQGMLRAIARTQLLVSVNTGVVHLAHALGKRMVILNGPTFGGWIPKGPAVRAILDELALYQGADKPENTQAFPMVARIAPAAVMRGVEELYDSTI